MDRPTAPALRAAFLAVLLVLAGCNGLGLSGGADGGTTPSSDAVTPAPVPATASPTGTPAADTPPGITESGVLDVEALTNAHRSVLANRSFAVTVQSTDRDRLSSLGRYTIRVGPDDREGDPATGVSTGGAVQLGRTPFLMTTDRGATPLAYGDADARFVRDVTTVDGDAVVESERVTMAPPITVRPVARGLNNIPNGAADVTQVRRDGETFFRVYVTDRGREVGENYSRSVAPVGGATNYSLTAYVRADGFVKTINQRYDVQRNGTRTRVEQRWTYRLDTGPVAEPDWATRTWAGNLSGYAAGEYPPGINESGLADSRDLWGAHRTILATHSFTLTRSGDQAWRALPQPTTVAVANRTRFLQDPWNGSDRYGDRSGYYVRDRVGGLAVEWPRTYWVDDPIRHGRQWLTGGNTSVERVERNGTTRFRLTVERPPPFTDLDPANFTATAAVRPDGLITEIRVDATVPGVTQADGEGYEWIDISYRYRYHDIGSTTVTEPDWVQRAKANQTATGANRTATDTG